MLHDAIERNQADGIAVCEAHEDLEVFRIRFGKALNFEYHEAIRRSSLNGSDPSRTTTAVRGDSRKPRLDGAGLFSVKGQREGGPILDIERALNKLEKVAMAYRRERGRPICVIVNNMCASRAVATDLTRQALHPRRRGRSCSAAHVAAAGRELARPPPLTRLTMAGPRRRSARSCSAATCATGWMRRD